MINLVANLIKEYVFLDKNFFFPLPPPLPPNFLSSSYFMKNRDNFWWLDNNFVSINDQWLIWLRICSFEIWKGDLKYSKNFFFPSPHPSPTPIFYRVLIFMKNRDDCRESSILVSINLAPLI